MVRHNDPTNEILYVFKIILTFLKLMTVQNADMSTKLKFKNENFN